MDQHFICANPVLPVENVKETAKFYEDKLGFKTTLLWEDPAYGVVKRGNAAIEFGDKRKAHAGTGVVIVRVADADAIHAEWQEKGIEFVGDLADREYGSRDFRVRDNNGNMLIVGHDLENHADLIQKGNRA